MKYDFDTIISRRGTNSYKWDIPEEENVLPMWVADMDFRTAPAIIDALQKRVAHGIFGYTKVPEAYYDAVVRWFDDRHRWQVDSRWIIYTNGVVPALSAIIKALAMPGDKVIVQAPAYNCFYSSIRNDGCELFANNLIYQDGRYVIDFADPNAFCKIPSLAFRRARRSTLPGCKSPISSQPMKRCAAVLTEPSISTRYATSIRSA